jgi:hypothetical protein
VVLEIELSLYLSYIPSLFSLEVCFSERVQAFAQTASDCNLPISASQVTGKIATIYPHFTAYGIRAQIEFVTSLPNNSELVSGSALLCIQDYVTLNPTFLSL